MMYSLSQQLALIRSHHQKWPVKVIPIANELGMKVYYTQGWSHNISGMIKQVSEYGGGGKSGYAIYVNDQHSTSRKRFTIAHEIAHFILHRDLDFGQLCR